MSTPCDLIPPDLRGQTCPHRDAIFFNTTTVAEIKDSLTKIEKRIEDMIKGMEEKYVTKLEFGPTQKLVYGLIGSILMFALIAILNHVLK